MLVLALLQGILLISSLIFEILCEFMELFGVNCGFSIIFFSFQVKSCGSARLRSLDFLIHVIRACIGEKFLNKYLLVSCLKLEQVVCALEKEMSTLPCTMRFKKTSLGGISCFYELKKYQYFHLFMPNFMAKIQLVTLPNNNLRIATMHWLILNLILYYPLSEYYLSRISGTSPNLNQQVN